MASTKVYIAIYKTDCDIELRVFALEEQAWEWRDAIAIEAWAEDFGEETPLPEFDVGQKYFDEVSGFLLPASFTVQSATIDWPE